MLFAMQNPDRLSIFNRASNLARCWHRIVDFCYSSENLIVLTSVWQILLNITQKLHMVKCNKSKSLSLRAVCTMKHNLVIHSKWTVRGLYRANACCDTKAWFLRSYLVSQQSQALGEETRTRIRSRPGFESCMLVCNLMYVRFPISQHILPHNCVVNILQTIAILYAMNFNYLLKFSKFA